MAGQCGGGTKKGGKWRACVDYTDLNEAYPKDSFPLPRIDQIVDATTGHDILSFLDTFSGYHQIPMHSPDAEKTGFITPHGFYCYNVMSFGLKNAGATYQRMVTRIFRPLIGKSMEVYIDDMLVKSKECPDHTRHLQETFELLRRHSVKLNPLKCAFGVSSGKFLGFMVTRGGGIEAIMDSHAPTSRKGVHISLHKSFEVVLCHPKGNPASRLESRMRPGSYSHQTISHRTTILVSPEARDTLYIYLAVSEISMSAALFKEDENWKQRPIFFVSKSLSEAEARYTHLE